MNTSASSPRTARRLLSASVASAVMVGGFAVAVTPASAQTAERQTTERPNADRSASRLDAAKRRCLEGLNRRVAALDRLAEAVRSSEHITDGHKATLARIISNAQSGMRELRPLIEAANDADSLKAPCTSMVEDYRVFAVIVPQAHITRVADTAGAAVRRLGPVEERIGQVIADAQAAGKDTADAEAAAQRFSAAIDKLEADSAGLADSALAVTPADYNADHGVLDGAKSQARTVRADAKAVRETGAAARAALKALHD